MRTTLDLDGTRIDPPPAAPTVGGFRPLPASGVVVTNDQVNVLREREGI